MESGTLTGSFSFPALSDGLPSAADARARAERELSDWEAIAQRSPKSMSINLGAPAPTAAIPSVAVTVTHGMALPPPMPVSPAGDIYRAAEERLLETEKRVRHESELAEVQRRQREEASELEAIHMKQSVLTELEQKEKNHSERVQREQQTLDDERMQLASREGRLKVAEAEYQDEVLKCDLDIKRRSLQSEEARRRTTQALEAKLRIELAQELEPQLRLTIEREVTHSVTQKVEADLRIEFNKVCQTMKEEIEAARRKMEIEIEAALTPKIEAALRPVLAAEAEQMIQESIVIQLQETSDAVVRLRNELQLCVDERDRMAADSSTREIELKSEIDRLTAMLIAEQERGQALALDVTTFTERLKSFEQERKLYPLLKEVESLSMPWLHVNQQLDVLKKENSTLKAGLDFSQREIQSLRSQQMEAIGGVQSVQKPTSPRMLSPQRMHSELLPHSSVGSAAYGQGIGTPTRILPQHESVNTIATFKSPHRAGTPYVIIPLFSSIFNQQKKQLQNSRSRANANATANSMVPCKNRFRHTPVKDAHTPTFPFKKQDRERIFFAEMELLKGETAKEQARRKRSSSQRTPTARKLM